jgi:MYXO-CTERM domain-containing protein
MKKFVAQLVAAVAALSPLWASATILSLSPSTQTAAVGDTVTVDVVVSGLTAAGQVVSAFDINVLYSNLLLSASPSGFKAEAQMGGLASGDAVFDDLGTGTGVNAGFGYSLLSDADLQGLQGDGFTLFSMSFIAVSDGAALLSFAGAPDFDRLLVGLQAADLNINVADACVAIGTGSCNAVPEPSSYNLALGALAGALGVPFWRRRRQAAG